MLTGSDPRSSGGAQSPVTVAVNLPSAACKLAYLPASILSVLTGHGQRVDLEGVGDDHPETRLPYQSREAPPRFQLKSVIRSVTGTHLIVSSMSGATLTNCDASVIAVTNSCCLAIKDLKRRFNYLHAKEFNPGPETITLPHAALFASPVIRPLPSQSTFL